MKVSFLKDTDCQFEGNAREDQQRLLDHVRRLAIANYRLQHPQHALSEEPQILQNMFLETGSVTYYLQLPVPQPNQGPLRLLTGIHLNSEIAQKVDLIFFGITYGT